jgi:hypothetical protein
MKEFQAENERRKTITENHDTTLLNASNNQVILLPNQQSSLTINKQTKLNTQEQRSNFDKNKTNKFYSVTFILKTYFLYKFVLDTETFNQCNLSIRS